VVESLNVSPAMTWVLLIFVCTWHFSNVECCFALPSAWKWIYVCNRSDDNMCLCVSQL